MTGYKYGNAWESFPCEPGQVWSAGPHRFMVANLLEDSLAPVLQGQTVDCLYSDPPWNLGNETRFRSHVGLERNVHFNEFLDGFIAVCKYTCPTGHLFIEMGKQHVELLENKLRTAGGKVLQRVDAFYNGYGETRPTHLVCATFGQARLKELIPNGIKGEPLTDLALSLTDAKVVFDPCIGLGMTARYCHFQDKACVGSELNPRRLANVLEWFSRIYEVKRI